MDSSSLSRPRREGSGNVSPFRSVVEIRGLAVQLSRVVRGISPGKELVSEIIKRCDDLMQLNLNFED